MAFPVVSVKIEGSISIVLRHLLRSLKSQHATCRRTLQYTSSLIPGTTQPHPSPHFYCSRQATKTGCGRLEYRVSGLHQAKRVTRCPGLSKAAINESKHFIVSHGRHNNAQMKCWYYQRQPFVLVCYCITCTRSSIFTALLKYLSENNQLCSERNKRYTLVWGALRRHLKPGLYMQENEASDWSRRILFSKALMMQ